MFNKKGFTLIELLATLLILGIIMVIIIPKLTRTYNDSKKNIYMESANRMVKTLEEYYVRKNIRNNFNGCSYNFVSDVNTCSDYSFDGTKPSSGNIRMDNDGKVNGYVVFDKYAFVIENNNVSEFDNVSDTGREYVFEYTGAEEDFVVPFYGNYKIELWGASGGKNGASFNHVDGGFGNGGYTSGVISLSKGDNLYVYVGQVGYNAILGSTSVTSSAYNGGGAGVGSSDGDDAGGSGGGATDVRLVNGDWNNFESLKSRIMVAAGGAGGNVSTYSNTSEIAGHGGGLTGVGTLYRWKSSVVSDLSLHATQTTGYKLGEGQAAVLNNPCAGSGAGGGYYGGKTQQSTSSCSSAGGGGSSYISGFVGCNSISEGSTENLISHTGSPIHYSGLFFTDSVMKAGNESMPTHDGLGTMNGNTGNGYAKITYLGLD